MERQEAWREDLVLIGKYVLQISGKASGGKLRASLDARGVDPDSVAVREAPRVLNDKGRWVYLELQEAVRQRMTGPIDVLVKCTFPAIREGDIPELVKAVVQAMTLGSTQGQVFGIDQKAGVRLLYELLGVDNGDEIAEEQYPEGEYDPDRTKDPPVPLAGPGVPGQPANGAPKPPVNGQAKPKPKPQTKPQSKNAKEAVERLMRALEVFVGPQVEHVNDQPTTGQQQ